MINCPRCNGNLIFPDEDGDLSCLECGELIPFSEETKKVHKLIENRQLEKRSLLTGARRKLVAKHSGGD